MHLLKSINKKLHVFVLSAWYKPKVSLWLWLFWPLSKIYQQIIKFKTNSNHGYRSLFPIIVVGNITVGGNGKTPAIIALIKILQQQGFRPGVISRGYPINPEQPLLVSEYVDARQVGDEALLISSKAEVPVVVCRDRVKAIKFLEAQQNCNILLSDDGLQNMSFQHDIEIVMVDGLRGLGNACLLPMGPLREPINRLKSVDFVVAKQVAGTESVITKHEYQLTLDFQALKPLLGNAKAFQAASKVYAVTAIANPESFFQALNLLGVHCETIAYPDHYQFVAEDFSAMQDGQIIMTEKDAVKCASFADDRFWCLPLEGKFDASFVSKLLDGLRNREGYAV